MTLRTATELVLNASAPTHEADGLLWIHAIPQVRTKYDGAVYPFDDPDVFDGMAVSLASQINTGIHQPEYLTDAKRIGHELANGVISLGVVRRSEVLTQDEAAELGVRIEEPAGIFFGVELNDIGRGALERKQLRFNSVGLSLIRPDERLNAADKPVRLWGAFARELSSTSQPHFKTLRPVEETVHLSLNDAPPIPQTGEVARVIRERFEETVRRDAQWRQRADVLADSAKYAGVTADDLERMLTGLAPMPAAAAVSLVNTLGVGFLEMHRAAITDGLNFNDQGDRMNEITPAMLDAIKGVVREELKAAAAPASKPEAAMNAAEPPTDLVQAVNDAGDSRSEVIAKMATAAGLEPATVEAILNGEVEGTPEQLDAMRGALAPEPAAAPDMNASDVTALRAEAGALRQTVDAMKAEREREKAEAAIRSLRESERVSLDFADTAKGGPQLLADFCDLYIRDRERFNRLWATQPRDQRDFRPRVATTGERVDPSEVSFSARPRTAGEVEANKAAIGAYATKHSVSLVDARAALMRQART